MPYKKNPRFNSLHHGLVGYWCTGGRGANPAEDHSGYRRLATVSVGAIRSKDRRGDPALEFNGTTGVASTGTGINAHLTGAFTISAWFYARSFGENSQGRICDNFGSGSGILVSVNNNSATSAVQFGVGGSLHSTGSNTVSLNTWHRATCTFNGTTGAAIYVDRQAAESFTGSSVSIDAGFDIGNRSSDTARAFDGWIADLRVYDRVITASEIALLADPAFAPFVTTKRRVFFVPAGAPATTILPQMMQHHGG